ncbi:MAG: acyl-CoA thioesterase [Alphaproteobacteria bacterium]|nr:acyl-CoA thioesterase [Alphaproteobacteria bacterium]
MSRDKRLQNLSAYPYRTSDTVRFSDQDSAGHVNNVSLCAYLETARLGFIREIGMMGRGEGGVRGISAGLNVSFLAESHWPGRVELGCGVIRVGTASVLLGGGAFKDGVCIAAAEMPIVRLKGATPHPIDDAFRATLERYRIAGF